MHTFLIVLHVMVCFVLILVVLLQRGKGSDMGAALGGGGSNTVFGSRGAGNFLTKLTTAAAIGFMLTSLSLSYLSQEAKVLDFDKAILEESAPAKDVPSAGALEEIEVEEAPAEGAAAEGSEATGARADELIEIEVDETGSAPAAP
jgi:preprotein translocase subunit SecG